MNMIDALFDRWPYLRRELNNPRDSYEIYRFRLRTFLKNVKKKISNPIPAILATRALYGKRKAADPYEGYTPAVKKGIMAWGVKNFLPENQEGEDSTSMQAHRARLNHQYKLPLQKRDKLLIRKLMDVTFPHRRHMIVNEMARVKEVLELYPILQDDEQVHFFLSVFSVSHNFE